MAKTKTQKKNKISEYNVATIVLDIIMLLLGLIFFIGTLAGKGDEIAAGFVRVVGGVLILIGIFELINFLRIKEKTVFDWIVFIIGCAIAITGIVFIINPLPIITIFNFVFGIIIFIYSIVIIVASVGTLRPAGAKYWWFSLLFGIAALGMGVFVTCFNGATKTLTIIIGITLVVGAIGGIANALLASQAKKEFKANSKILEDATYTVESETTEEKKDSDSDDTVKY
ncbi:uncharacterized membrane protein HdeD (DUF308 family) [Ruminococcaceae bacterium R-25]|nr:uncharacterized membrane protein HdeD (DUF308 family) [Ruminococcaceae bacterium R-25]SUQ22360.1 Uncharacterized membrane protein HdeD, DUF308 family [Oscillospiraceae bacterium]